MKPSKRNISNAEAKAEARKGKAPLQSKYSAKVQRQMKYETVR